jgi:hypothetical protein
MEIVIMASKRPETDTWHMRPNFKPRGRAKDNAGWIWIEQMDGSLPVLGDGHLGIELYDETPDNVRRVAAFLDEHIQMITYTGPIRPEWTDQPGRVAVMRRAKRRGKADD